MSAEQGTLQNLLPLSRDVEVVLTTNFPELVCVVLVRFATQRELLRLPPKLQAKCAKVKWAAIREPHGHEVTLILKEGPLNRCILKFTGRPLQNGSHSIVLVGGYQPRKAFLYGILEEKRARRTAENLRDGVIQSLKYCLEQFNARSGMDLPASDRHPLAGTLRVRGGSRVLQGILLNVSMHGLDAAFQCSAEEAPLLIRDFEGQRTRTIEVIDPPLDRPLPAMVRHASSLRGGIKVDFEVSDRMLLTPLLKKAAETP